MEKKIKDLEDELFEITELYNDTMVALKKLVRDHVNILEVKDEKLVTLIKYVISEDDKYIEKMKEDK